MTEKVACKGHGRYVRLLLTQPDASGRYALSEMQVMGKGGLRAEAANTLASKDGKQMLNQWQLRREGSDAWIHATVPGTVLTSYMNIGAVPSTLISGIVLPSTISHLPTRTSIPILTSMVSTGRRISS